MNKKNRKRHKKKNPTGKHELKHLFKSDNPVVNIVLAVITIMVAIIALTVAHNDAKSTAKEETQRQISAVVADIDSIMTKQLAIDPDRAALSYKTGMDLYNQYKYDLAIEQFGRVHIMV